MAKKQSRRCFSVKRDTHARLRALCEDEGVSMSSWVEDLLTEKLDAAGVPVPETVAPKKRRPDPLPPKIGSGTWEF